MKSIKVCLLASLLAMTVSLREGYAQTAPTPSAAEGQQNTEEVKLTPEQLAQGKEITVLTGMKRQYDEMIKRFADSMWQSGKKDPNVMPVLEQILIMLKPEFDLLVDQMVNDTAQVFASKIPEKDLKQIIDFFKSDTGRLYVAKQPLLMNQLIPVIGDWTRRSEEYVQTRARAEFAKLNIIISIPRNSSGETGDGKNEPQKTPENAAAPKASPLPEPSAEQIAIAKRVALASGITRSYDSLISQIVLNARDLFVRDPGMNEVKNAVEIVDSTLVDLQPEIEKLREQIIDETAKTLAQIMPEDKMKEIGAFFDSEAGKVYVEKQPQILDTLMPEMDTWTKKVVQYINVRTSAELAKKGFHYGKAAQ